LPHEFSYGAGARLNRGFNSSVRIDHYFSCSSELKLLVGLALALYLANWEFFFSRKNRRPCGIEKDHQIRLGDEAGQ
jgi:hypothetical protein